MTTYTPVVLEPASRAFVEATATPPFLYELTPAEARNGAFADASGFAAVTDRLQDRGYTVSRPSSPPTSRPGRRR
jgi:hypothetical protein